MKYLLLKVTILLLVTLQLLGNAVSTSQAAGNSYYVDIQNPNARDASDYGSLTKPWKTLEYAFKRLKPGDTLLIRGGTYKNASITLTASNSGQSGAPITVKAYPNEQVLLKNGGSIYFYGAKWWVIDGLIFEDAQGPFLRLGLHEKMGYSNTYLAEHITVRNSEFRHGRWNAIAIFYGNDILVENNYFHHLRVGKPFSQEHREVVAVPVMYIGDNIVIRNNRFEDIGSDGVHLGSHTYISGAYIGKVDIIDNEFWINRPYTGILGNVGENAIDVKKSTGPILISGNKIRGFRPTTPEQDASGDPGGYGVVIHNNARNVILERNLFYNNTSHLAIKQGSAGTAGGTRDIIVRNNLFKQAQRSDTSSVGGFGIRMFDVAKIGIYHNTFYDNEYYIQSSGVRDSIFKNNLILRGKLLINNSEWETGYNAWSQVSSSHYAALQSSRDIFDSNLRLDNNLRPSEDSPVIDIGVNLGVTTDFMGSSRDEKPDLGAIELTTNITVPAEPHLQVNSTQNTINKGDTIEVQAELTNVNDLYGLQVNCTVDPSVLLWTSAQFSTFFTDPLIGAKSLDAVAGTWTGAISQKNPAPPLSGNGVFATFTFQAIAPGTTDIVCEPLASDRDGIALALSASGSTVTVSESTVPTDETGLLAGTVTYQGRSSHAGIEIVAVGTTDAGLQTDDNGHFEVDGLTTGSYGLKADAPLYLPSCITIDLGSGQTLSLNPTALAGGDANDDNEIRISDATLLGSNFGLSTTSAPQMDPKADINGDGQVNIQDLSILGGNFGKQGCQEWTAAEQVASTASSG